MEDLTQLFANHGLRILDILGAVVGLIYIYLEYRASIYLWFVSIIMPIIDMWLYLEAGLYADFGLAIYYTLAAIYGYVMWRYWGKSQSKEEKGKKEELKITHLPLKKVKWVVVTFSLIWWGIYIILTHWTNSAVPINDSFSSALSIIALWALAHKYLEQWFFWLIVDVFSCALYTYKGIPFKAGLYGLYVVIAIFGYFKWKRMMQEQQASKAPEGV